MGMGLEEKQSSKSIRPSGITCSQSLVHTHLRIDGKWMLERGRLSHRARGRVKTPVAILVTRRPQIPCDLHPVEMIL